MKIWYNFSVGSNESCSLQIVVWRFGKSHEINFIGNRKFEFVGLVNSYLVNDNNL